MDKELEELNGMLEKKERLMHMLSILSYDLETAAPEGGMEADSADIVELSAQMFAIEKDPEFERCLLALHGRDDFDAFENRLIHNLYRDYRKNRKVTPELQKEVDSLFQEAYRVWAKAREKKDYALFAPVLGRIVEISRHLVSLRDDYDPAKPYQSLIDDYEEGFTQADLDSFFDELEKGIVPLVEKVRKADYVPRHDFLSRKVPVAKQELFSRALLRHNGFDFRRGSLSTTIHPFTTQIGKDDVRVTTHYHEDQFLSNMFTIIHEGGHAIFGQNLPERTFTSHLGEGALSMGKHESVSRFYENILGRSRAYIHGIYPLFAEIFKDEMADVTEEDLYEGANYVFLDNAVRTEADELTYSLHILIRYRLEKALMEGRIGVGDLAPAWNGLYGKYLGVTPRDDVEGILQDVHWTSGFGYFPTYAIGNALGAAYFQTMEGAMDVEKVLSGGRMDEVLSWMRENVFKKAMLLDTKPWIEEITGKPFSAKPYVEYLTKKFSSLYRL